MMRNLHFSSRGAALGAALALLLLTAPGLAHAVSIGLSGTGGSDVTVTVTVEGIESLSEPSLGSYDLDLFFDDSVLAFSDIEFGPFLGGPILGGPIPNRRNTGRQLRRLPRPRWRGQLGENQ